MPHFCSRLCFWYINPFSLSIPSWHKTSAHTVHFFKSQLHLLYLTVIPLKRTGGIDIPSGHVHFLFVTHISYYVTCFFVFGFLGFLKFIYFYFWLRWVFVSVWGLSLVAASGGHSSSRCAGLSLSRPLLLRSTRSRRAGSAFVAHGPSCSVACGIFPDQGSNPCPLHWQADSQPLRHQGSPMLLVFKTYNPVRYRAQSLNSPCGWQKDFLTTSAGSFLWNFPRSTRRVGGPCSVQMPTWWTSTKWGHISTGSAPNSCILTVQRTQTSPGLSCRQVIDVKTYGIAHVSGASRGSHQMLLLPGECMIYTISFLLFRVGLQLDCVCWLYIHVNMACLSLFIFAC